MTTPGDAGQPTRDPRRRRWLLRLALAAVVGAPVAVLVTWEVGVGLAVLVIVGHTIYQARHSPPADGGVALSGAGRKTERQLRSLKRSGWKIMPGRSIPGTENQIDHLVIGPTGVYAIDSEKWDKRMPVRAMSHRKLFHGPFNQKERLDETRFESEQAAKWISENLDTEVVVQGSLAIYGPPIPWSVLTVREVDVYAGGRARKYLKRGPKTLGDKEIQKIGDAAERALPMRDSQQTARAGGADADSATKVASRRRTAYGKQVAD